MLVYITITLYYLRSNISLYYLRSFVNKTISAFYLDNIKQHLTVETQKIFVEWISDFGSTNN